MSSVTFGRVMTAMVTPFDECGQINASATCQLVDHLLANGTESVVVCGTTGESPTLSYEEKLGLFRLVKQALHGRAPMIAGTGSNDTNASIRLTRDAAEAGADAALLVVPPYNKPSQEGMYLHFRSIAESVPDLPCFLYNVPGRTSQNLEAATVLRLAHELKNIVAIKEASGNLMQATEILAGAPKGFLVYSGDDGLTLPMLALGGHGVISVTAHLIGRLMSEMHEAFFKGDYALASAINLKMLPMVRACFQPGVPNPAPVKAGLNILGVRAGGLRLPLVETTEKETEIVRQALIQTGIL